MHPKTWRASSAPTLISLVLLLTGCAGAPLALEPVPAPAIPPLPQSARQPAPAEICTPTCSAGLARLLDSLLPSPTSAAEPAPSAPGATTR